MGYMPFRPPLSLKLFKESSPPFFFLLWLGAKEVVLQKLKRLCHMIQWAIVGKGARGVEHTIT